MGDRIGQPGPRKVPDETLKTAEALWYVGPGRAEIREEKLAPLTPHHLRVRALYGALSRGTEALVLRGSNNLRLCAHQSTHHLRMRAA